MEKKNPFKFTLGFDKTKASHIRAVELLNSVKDKADLIAEAIVAHVDGIQESNTFSNEVYIICLVYFGFSICIANNVDWNFIKESKQNILIMNGRCL